MPTIITITATFREADDATPCKGSVVIRPLTRIVDTAGKVLLEDTPVTVSLNGAGQISHGVVASDSPGIAPTGVGYHITERIRGAPTRSYAVLIPAASSGGTVDLASLAPVVAADAMGVLADMATQVELDAEATIRAAAITAEAAARAAADNLRALLTDARFTDQRTPTDGTVTDAKVAAGANIAESKIANLVADLAAKLSATDPSVTNARMPNAHASTHQPGSTDAMVVEAYRVVGATGQPAFQNSWVTYGSPYDVAAFYKDPFGVVRMKGLVIGATSNSMIFTLPAGYRPLGLFSAPSNPSFGATCRIWPNGDVESLGGSFLVALDVSFRGEQ